MEETFLQADTPERALLTLSASVAVTIAAQHVYATHATWAGFLDAWFEESHAPESFAPVYNELVNANQQAAVLGWVGVILTGLLLAMGLLGIAPLVMPGRQRHPPASYETGMSTIVPDPLPSAVCLFLTPNPSSSDLSPSRERRWAELAACATELMMQ